MFVLNKKRNLIKSKKILKSRNRIKNIILNRAAVIRGRKEMEQFRKILANLRKVKLFLLTLKTTSITMLKIVRNKRVQISMISKKKKYAFLLQIFTLRGERVGMGGGGGGINVD